MVTPEIGTPEIGTPEIGTPEIGESCQIVKSELPCSQECRSVTFGSSTVGSATTKNTRHAGRQRIAVLFTWRRDFVPKYNLTLDSTRPRALRVRSLSWPRILSQTAPTFGIARAKPVLPSSLPSLPFTLMSTAIRSIGVRYYFKNTACCIPLASQFPSNVPATHSPQQRRTHKQTQT